VTGGDPKDVSLGEDTCRACRQLQSGKSQVSHFVSGIPVHPGNLPNSEYRWKCGSRAAFRSKCQRVGTTCPRIERSIKHLSKPPAAVLEGKSSIEDLLLVLNFSESAREDSRDEKRSEKSSASRGLRKTQTISSTVARLMNPGFCSLSCRSKITLAGVSVLGRPGANSAG